MAAALKSRVTQLKEMLSKQHKASGEKEAAHCARQVSVLIVPDNAEIKSTVQRSLPSGWALLAADSIEEAVTQVKLNHVPVVLCCETNALNWHEAVLLLSRPPCNASVVVVSPTVTQRHWDSLVHCGGYEVIPASADPDRMLAVIRSAWSEWKNARALEN